MQGPVALLMADDGLAREGQQPEPTPWQDPEVVWKPRAIALTFAKPNGAGDTYCLHKKVSNKDAWVVRGTTPQVGSDGDSGDVRETGLAPVAPFGANC